jgi:hypothetical protein
MERIVKDIGEVLPARKSFTIKKKPDKYHSPLNRMPNSKEEIHALADELMQWAQNPNSLFMQQFAIEKKIAPYLFFQMGKSGRNEYFTQAFDYARAACSVRLVSSDNKVRDVVLNRLMPVYDTFLGEFTKEQKLFDHELQKELKAIDAQKSGPSSITVVMEPVENSNISPCLENK